jgi:hypothetical protein
MSDHNISPKSFQEVQELAAARCMLFMYELSPDEKPFNK